MEKFEEVIKNLAKINCGLSLHYGQKDGADHWTCRIALPPGHKYSASPPWGTGANMVDATLAAVVDLGKRV